VSDANASDEWDVVVPDDGETLLEELRRRGVKPGQVLHMRSAGSGRSEGAAAPSDAPRRRRPARHADGAPGFFRSIHSGERHLGRRSKEILRSEFPAPGA
jgi:hypothetical protein